MGEHTSGGFYISSPGQGIHGSRLQVHAYIYLNCCFSLYLPIFVDDKRLKFTALISDPIPTKRLKFTALVLDRSRSHFNTQPCLSARLRG